MSGGSWDHFYLKLIEVTERMQQEKEHPERVKFANKILLPLIDVMRSIEYVDSGDSSKPADTKAIANFYGGLIDHTNFREFVEMYEKTLKIKVLR